jgi:hypothetical protein
MIKILLVKVKIQELKFKVPLLISKKNSLPKENVVEMFEDNLYDNYFLTICCFILSNIIEHLIISQL